MAYPEVMFTRADGAQLAMLRGDVLERASTGDPWVRIALLEGSRSYRWNRLQTIAERRGFLVRDDGASAPDPEGGGVSTVRGQLANSAGRKRVQVMAEHPVQVLGQPNGYRARREHGEHPWVSSLSLVDALAAACECPSDDPALKALAARLAARFPPTTEVTA